MALPYASTIHISWAFAAVLTSGPGYAQTERALSAEQSENGEIIVTGKRILGSVVTRVPPLEEIDEAEIESLGASSVQEVIEAVSPQANSGRARGGRPVFLLNGQRISSFRELRDLPPEAIRRVQIFPEEIALQYGFRPDQRVINFILKGNFASAQLEVEHGQPQSGGFGKQEYEGGFTRIGKNYRLNIDAEYETATALTEDERGIIQSESDRSTFSGDLGQFRTLLPSEERFEINSSYSRTLAPQTSLSFNANYELEDTTALLGLPSASLALPADNPFSPFADDVIINRAFNSPRPLSRDRATHILNFGSAFNSLIGPWRWSLTGDYNLTDTEQQTFRDADVTALQAGLNDGSLNPFAENFGDNLRFLAPDTSDSTAHTLEIRNSFSGELFRIPSGPVQVTLGQNFEQQWLDTGSVVSGTSAEASLRRRAVAGTANIEIPLVERDFGPLGFLGEVSVNTNYGLTDLSDFGRLQEYGFGLTWSPADSLTIQASFISEESPPDISTLGAPTVVTPNSNFFDIANNETVSINAISGGNPDLRAEKRNDIKLSVSWKPDFLDGATLQSEYFRNKSSNVTSDFPLLTPEIEAAFPDRVIRSADGRLSSVDQRAVTYDALQSKSLRSGISYRGRIQTGDAERPRRDRAAGRRAGAARPGRWSISLFHTWRFRDEILIRPGVPVLDRLNGSANNFFGGTARHQIELSGGIFHKGMGARLSGEYRSGTRIDGSGLAQSTDLAFSDRLSLDARLFVSLDQRGELTRKLPFLKGGRVRLVIRNIFNDYIRVTDASGATPLNYQRGFVDPQGRFFELNFRKRF